MSEKNTNTTFIFKFDDRGFKQARIYTPMERQKEALKLYEKLRSGIEEMDRQIQNHKGGCDNEHNSN